MNAAEFQAVVDTLEQDHHLVLDKMMALKQAVHCLFDPQPADVRRTLERLQELNRFFVTQFTNHLEEEEVTLFPLLERQGREGSELAARLRGEHTEIQHRLEEFNNCLQITVELEDTPPTAVRRDLLLYGWEFLEALDQHAHVETQAVGKCIARSVSEGDG